MLISAPTLVCCSSLTWFPSHWARTATSAELTRWPWSRTSCRSGLLMTSAERGRQEGNGVSLTSGKARFQQPGRGGDRNVWEVRCETAGTEGAHRRAWGSVPGQVRGLGVLQAFHTGCAGACLPDSDLWYLPKQMPLGLPALSRSGPMGATGKQGLSVHQVW